MNVLLMNVINTRTIYESQKYYQKRITYFEPEK